MKRRLALVALACLVGCSREPTQAERTLAILTAHHALGAEWSGIWVWSGSGGPVALSIEPLAEPGRVLVRSASAAAMGGERNSGAVEHGVLTLAAPLAGSLRFHLCRFDAGDVLVPETGVSFADAEHPIPAGHVFSRQTVLDPGEATWLRSISGPDEEVDDHLGDE